MSERQPSEEELREALEEQMRRVRVEDVIVQTAVTLVNIAGRRLGLTGSGDDQKELPQARLAIEGARALLPLLAGDEAAAVRDALSQLQIAYAREAGGQRDPETPGESGPSTQPRSDQEAERAKARSKIWTPPGAG